MSATPRLFLYFFKLNRPSSHAKRIGIGQRDQRNVCVAFLPMNYAKWKSEYFFVSSEFLSGSRDTWMEGDEIDFHLHPSLDDAESKGAQRINEMCHEHGFEKGVPFWLATREDFSFEMQHGSSLEVPHILMLCCRMRPTDFTMPRKKKFLASRPSVR